MQFTDIIWDFDGTLFDTYPVMVKAILKALKEAGIEETYEEVLKQSKVTVPHAIAHFKGKYGLPDSFVERHKYNRDNIIISESSPFPFVEEICKRTSAKGIRNFIFTHRGDTVFEYIKDRGLEAYFTDIVSKGKIFKSKPDPEGFLHIINKHGLNKETVLTVGDRDIDILAGEASGIKTCLFFQEETGPCKPDYIIHSLDELFAILDI